MTYINKENISYKLEKELSLYATCPDKISKIKARLVKKIKEDIDNTPAANVEEVKHGHNATSMHPVDEFLCSVCGFCCADYTETKYDDDGDYTYSCECEFDYCPKCGAKMDGGVEK